LHFYIFQRSGRRPPALLQEVVPAAGHGLLQPADQDARAAQGRVGKNPDLKKNSPVGFFCFFLFFLFFCDFCFFKNIFAQKREFLGFFQFQEYF
jgi:hypothetical protein